MDILAKIGSIITEASFDKFFIAYLIAYFIFYLIHWSSAFASWRDPRRRSELLLDDAYTFFKNTEKIIFSLFVSYYVARAYRRNSNMTVVKSLTIPVGVLLLVFAINTFINMTRFPEHNNNNGTEDLVRTSIFFVLDFTSSVLEVSSYFQYGIIIGLIAK